jgi:hypothetical protein
MSPGSPEVVYAAWRAEPADSASLPAQTVWWAVRMEHTPAEQPDAGRITGALLLAPAEATRLLSDPHELAHVAYGDPQELIGEVVGGRYFANMTGWARES